MNVPESRNPWPQDTNPNRPRAGRGIGGHERGYRGGTDEWLTPPEIIKSVGSFDLDPCSPIHRPWPTAAAHYTIMDDGLSRPWNGRVWLNPPYGPETGRWLRRLAEHDDGIALVFARTETEAFHRWGWDVADAMLFLRGRLCFYTPAGRPAPGNAGGPSVLIAYGAANAERLKTCGLRGRFVNLRGTEESSVRRPEQKRQANDGGAS
jgi:hypothetical protein